MVVTSDEDDVATSTGMTPFVSTFCLEAVIRISKASSASLLY